MDSTFTYGQYMDMDTYGQYLEKQISDTLEWVFEDIYIHSKFEASISIFRKVDIRALFSDAGTIKSLVNDSKEFIILLGLQYEKNYGKVRNYIVTIA